MKWFDSITATPKKRAGTLFVLGCLATLALPPFFLLPLLAVSACGWLSLLLRAETLGQAFRTGWWWGLGFFISGLYWICISLLVDAERFAWMIPFALFGLNGLIAIFPGLASAGFYWLYKRFSPSGYRIVLLFAACWSLSEFARSYLFTGFPWNLPGYMWAAWLPGMQGAALIGIHGLTLLTMLLALLPLLYRWGEKELATKILFAWMLLLAWGMWRVDQLPKMPDNQPNVRIVQAAIPQSLKWDPRARLEGIRKHMALTREAEGAANIIVWPESAVPMAIDSEPMLEQDLRALLQEGQLLITGGLSVDVSPDPNVPAMYNSVYSIQADGIQNIYDKHHLVPFGEFVPLRRWLPIDKITPGTIDYSHGFGPQTVALDGVPSFSPLVCYEAIFPQEAVARDEARPHWLVNVTNDAWFGHSTGPYQHLHMTRFRAVEQGLPLIRAANTGISAVIDAHGRLLNTMAVNHSGTITAKLPPRLAATPYYYIGNWVYIALLACFMAASLGCFLFRRLKS